MGGKARPAALTPTGRAGCPSGAPGGDHHLGDICLILEAAPGPGGAGPPKAPCCFAVGGSGTPPDRRPTSVTLEPGFVLHGVEADCLTSTAEVGSGRGASWGHRGAPAAGPRHREPMRLDDRLVP